MTPENPLLSKSISNAKNALLSTGPKTPEGKEVSSRNSLKHGLSSHTSMLPDEDAEEWAELLSQCHEDMKPVGAREIELVNQIADSLWRLRRFRRVETSLLFSGHHQALAHQAAIKAHETIYGNSEPKEEPDLDILAVVSKRDRSIAKDALKRKWKHRAALDTDMVGLGFAFANAEDTFSKLSRYETTLHNNLLKTMHELERIQAVRQGKNVVPPLAIDISGAVPETSEIQPKLPVDISA